MKTNHNFVAVIAAVLLLGLIASIDQRAASQPPAASPDLNEAIVKLADAIEKGKDEDVKKQTDAIVKALDGIAKGPPAMKYEDVMGKVMHTMYTRSRAGVQLKKPGIGVGAKAGAVAPDGIEDKLQDLVNKGITQDQLNKEAVDLEKMARMIRAVAEVCKARPPQANWVPQRFAVGKAPKAPNLWVQWSTNMGNQAIDLGKAAKAKDPKALQAAAVKSDANCALCH